jgi:hypothetical protein
MTHSSEWLSLKISRQWPRTISTLYLLTIIRCCKHQGPNTAPWRSPTELRDHLFVTLYISQHTTATIINRAWRMASSGMLRDVALVRTDVSEERSASFIRVTRIHELGTTRTVTSNRRKLRRNTNTLGIYSQREWLLVTVRVVPSSWILVTLMKEALRSS